MTARAVAWSPGALGPLLADDGRDLSWQDLARCAETDPEAFFVERGGSTRPAKRVCAACEVRAECLEYALEHRIRDGVWGGTSERERRALLNARDLAAGISRCSTGRHALTEDNRLPDGNCMACSEASRKGQQTRRLAA